MGCSDDRSPGRWRGPGRTVAHRRARPGATWHAVHQLGRWYVLGVDGIGAIVPDREALLAWCYAHVRQQSDDVVIIHRAEPEVDA